MKKYASLALCLVLTAALLVGCGCTNQNMGDSNASTPTVLPTNEEVWNEPTTAATTGTTAPSATIDRGNGALEDDTANGSTGMNGGTGSAGGTGTTGGTDTTGGTGTTGGAGTTGGTGSASRSGSNGGIGSAGSSQAMPNGQ